LNKESDRYIVSSYGPMVKEWWSCVVESKSQAREVFRRRVSRYPKIGCVVYGSDGEKYDYFPGRDCE
jgi:hypothetical protein